MSRTEDIAAAIAWARGGEAHEGPCLNYEGQDPFAYDKWDSCYLHIEASDRHLRLLADAAASAQERVDLEPGDYWLTSIGDGRGRAIVTMQRRLLVEQFPSCGKTLWSDLTGIYATASWHVEPRVALSGGES